MDTESSSSRGGQIVEIPRQPPVEIVEQGRVWLVEEYHRGPTEGEVFSTHDSQIDAVRAAKAKMEGDRHPCALRWDSSRSVGNLYWNPLFECLEVRYDELLEGWTILPTQGTCAMAICEDRQAACEQAKQVQHGYNFKHLRAYDRSASEYEEREHRFLRHDITSSGVTFDPSAFTRPTETDETPSGDDERPTDTESDEAHVRPASPGQLGASVPDVTKVEFIEADGILHRYATPWGDGTNAEILAVSQKYADNSQICMAFETFLSRWRDVDSHPNVATVYESGTDPVPWVTYQVSGQTLDAVGTDLPVENRVSALTQIGDALTTVATVDDDPVCGMRPEWIYVHEAGTDERVTIAQMGLEWAVQRGGGIHEPTPYTAPEQLDGKLTQTTAVYQFGAVAYYLLCESPPITRADDVGQVIRAGDIPPARPVAAVSPDTGAIIDRCLETDPARRYDSVTTVCQALQSVL